MILFQVIALPACEHGSREPRAAKPRQANEKPSFAVQESGDQCDGGRGHPKLLKVGDAFIEQSGQKGERKPLTGEKFRTLHIRRIKRDDQDADVDAHRWSNNDDVPPSFVS